MCHRRRPVRPATLSAHLNCEAVLQETARRYTSPSQPISWRTASHQAIAKASRAKAEKRAKQNESNLPKTGRRASDMAPARQPKERETLIGADEMSSGFAGRARRNRSQLGGEILRAFGIRPRLRACPLGAGGFTRECCHPCPFLAPTYAGNQGLFAHPEDACAPVFAAGPRPTEVVGPLLEDEAAQLQAHFWKTS